MTALLSSLFYRYIYHIPCSKTFFSLLNGSIIVGMVVLTRLGPPEEGIHHAEEKTSVYVNDKCLGKGKVYISEARVSWVGEQDQEKKLPLVLWCLYFLLRFHLGCP